MLGHYIGRFYLLLYFESRINNDRGSLKQRMKNSEFQK